MIFDYTKKHTKIGMGNLKGMAYDQAISIMLYQTKNILKLVWEI